MAGLGRCDSDQSERPVQENCCTAASEPCARETDYRVSATSIAANGIDSLPPDDEDVICSAGLREHRSKATSIFAAI